jgi:hypothetical protein
MSLIIYLIGRHDKKKEQENAKDTGQSRMLVGLGHDRIMSLTDYYVRRGGITLKEKRNLEFLYKPYAELGGNGDCKIGYEACQQLEVLSEDEAQAIDVREKRKEYGIET